MLSSTVQYLVERIVDSYNENYDSKKDDISDCIHSILDDYVSCNHFNTNIDIINEEVGGIYEAMKLQEETFGQLDEIKDMTRPMFYAKLAFISLLDTVTDEVMEHFKDEE